MNNIFVEVLTMGNINNIIVVWASFDFVRKFFYRLCRFLFLLFVLNTLVFFVPRHKWHRKYRRVFFFGTMVGFFVMENIFMINVLVKKKVKDNLNKVN